MSQNWNQFKLRDSLYRRIKNFHEGKKCYNPKRKCKKTETIFLCEMQEKLYIDGPTQGILDLDRRNSQKYLHQTWANF